MGERTINISDYYAVRRDHFNPIFDIITGEFDNNFKELELDLSDIIEKLYVDKRLDKGVTNSRILKLFSISGGNLRSMDDFIAPFVKNKGLVYLVLGKKGIGKTTFLYNVVHNAVKGNVEGILRDDFILYLDMKNFRYDDNFKQNLPQSLEKLMFWEIENESHAFSKYFQEGTYTRKLHKRFKKVIDDQELIDKIYANENTSVHHLLSWLKKAGHNLYLVVDNLDDFDKRSIRTIFDTCFRFKSTYSMKCVVALRDWWTPDMLHAGDRNLCSRQLTLPDIYSIIQRRIYAIDHSQIDQDLTLTYNNNIELTFSSQDLLDIFNKIVRELTLPRYKDLFHKLLSMSNFSIRELLVNIYHFFHSPYLISSPNFINIISDNILEIDKNAPIDEARDLRLHDFLQNMMAVHTLCYDIKDSIIFNIFHHEIYFNHEYNYKNVLIYSRILKLLNSRKDYKYIDLLKSLECIGYMNRESTDAIKVLLNKSLIESPEGIDIKYTKTLSVSAKGKIYLNEISLEYTYLVYVCDAVPMEDKYKVNIKDKFGDEEIVVVKGNLSEKFRSVDLFIDFIKVNEDEEERNCPNKYIRLLSRIKGENISTKMIESVEKTKSIMSSGHGKRQKNRSVTGLTGFDIVKKEEEKA